MTDERTLLVNEMYPCLQGEGYNLGKPSILLRLQVCNLRCTWCDTPYTHTLKSDPSADIPTKQKFSRFTIEQLKTKIFEISHLNHIIISGGEPTLQNFLPLANLLGEKYTFEVESNGTQIPHEKFSDFHVADYQRFQWNISPKGKAADQEINDAALEHWAKLSTQLPLVFFKFVIRHDHLKEDIAEVNEIVEKHNIKKQKVYLMAEGNEREAQLNSVWLHDICLELGFQYSPRLHVLLFGAKRGV